jgi:WD40 repeat protein
VLQGLEAETSATGHANAQNQQAKAKIFISYSRKDMAFADRLEVALKAQGFEPLIDRTEIYAFEDWWRRIEALIGKADTVVFVLSPDSVASDICAKEVARAAALNKRFAPVVSRRVEDGAVPEPLRRLNFIFFDEPGSFEASTARLVEALRTDIGWIRKHTEFGEAARQWVEAGRPDGLLLRSPTLEEAEHWIASRPTNAPGASAETQTFIAESRRGATRRRNILTGALAAGLMLALILAGLAYWQRSEAIKQRDQTMIAQSQFLTDRSRAALDGSDYPGAAGLALAALPEDMRSPDRPYVSEAEVALNAAIQNLKERFVLAGHQGNIVELNFSPDGKMLVTTAQDGTARVWDVVTGKSIAVLRGESGTAADGASGNGTDSEHAVAYGASFNPAGNLVVLAYRTAEATVFEASSGRAVLTLPGSAAGFENAYFSKDGRRIVGKGRDETRVWQLEGGTVLAVWPGLWLAESEDGRRIATVTANPETVLVWDAQTGQKLAALSGHTGEVTAASFSADGSSLVTCSVDHSVRIWNVEKSGDPPVVVDQGERVAGCAMRPDGAQIATVSTFGTGNVLDAHTGVVIVELASDDLPLGPVRFVDGGRFVLIQSGDVRGLQNIQAARPGALWNAQTGRLEIDLHGKVLVGANDADFLASSNDPAFAGLRLFGGDDVRELVNVGRGPGQPEKTAMSADALNFAAAFGHVAVLWNRSGPGFVTDLPMATVGAQFTPDGRGVLALKDDGTAQIVNISDGEVRCTMTGHRARLNRAAFSPDGERLVTAAQDAAARLWDLKNGCSPIAALNRHSRDVRDAVFSPDGRVIATASADGSVRFWDGTNGREEGPAIEGFARPVDRVAFSRDGASLAVQTSGGDVQVFDAKTRQPVPGNEPMLAQFKQQFEEQRGPTRRTADGELTLTNSRDVTLSDARTDTVKALFSRGPPGENSPFAAEFTDDGSHILLVYRSVIRVVQVAKSTQALIEYAHQVLPRCLSKQEREEAHLGAAPPRWCLGKWPYVDAP